MNVVYVSNAALHTGTTPHQSKLLQLIEIPLPEWPRTCAIFRAYVHAYTARCLGVAIVFIAYHKHIMDLKVEHMDVALARQAR